MTTSSHPARMGLTAVVAASLALGGTAVAHGVPTTAERDGANLKTRAVKPCSPRPRAPPPPPRPGRRPRRQAPRGLRRPGDGRAGPGTAALPRDRGRRRRLHRPRARLDPDPRPGLAALGGPGPAHTPSAGDATVARGRVSGRPPRPPSWMPDQHPRLLGVPPRRGQPQLRARRLGHDGDAGRLGRGRRALRGVQGRRPPSAAGAGRLLLWPCRRASAAPTRRSPPTAGSSPPATSTPGRTGTSSQRGRREPRHVTTLQMPTGFAAAEPAWSPDGRHRLHPLHRRPAGEVSRFRAARPRPRHRERPGGGRVGGHDPARTGARPRGWWPQASPPARASTTSRSPAAPRRDRRHRERRLPGSGPRRPRLVHRRRRHHLPRAGRGAAGGRPGRHDADQHHPPLAERPRVAPDGTVYVVDVDMHDVDNPDDNTFTVVRADFGPTGMEGTAIGAPLDRSFLGFHGYDVRQPKSTGTSDLAGDANPDVLARDSSGTQWVYPMTQDLDTGAPKFGSRVLSAPAGRYSAILSRRRPQQRWPRRHPTRDTSGRLWRYDGRGGAKVAPRVQIGAAGTATTRWPPVTSTATAARTSWPVTAAATCGSTRATGGAA